ncbi:STAS domain-containing protein [Streptomyces sp. NPDC002668]|uniref:STAS domain-containing protein n=1 Tax=Streptomyces sp. NPDC002668 TaxID=3154422 RepID=UPI00331D543B
MSEGLTSRPYGLLATLPGAYGRAYRRQERTVVELRGEIDIAAVTVIGAYLDVVTSVRAHEVVVDLTHVEFLDCSGLALLCRARRRTTEFGGRLCVVCARPTILRVFKAGGVLDVFRTLPTLDAALAAQGG